MCITLLVGQMLFAQGTNNPFEIEHRLSVSNTSAAKEISKNPFELVRQPSKKSNRRAEKVINMRPISDAPKPQHLLAIALIAIVPVTFLFTLFRNYFNQAYQNVISGNTLVQSLREYTSTAVIPTNLWYLAALLNIGIFLALALRIKALSITQNLLHDVLICIGIVGALIFIKHLVLQIIHFVFPIGRTVRQYNYLIILFGIVLGVALLPVNIALLYTPEELTYSVLWVGLGLIIVSYTVRGFRGLVIGNTLLTSYGFHFLLYICTVEIAPILILIKFASLYSGKF